MYTRKRKLIGGSPSRSTRRSSKTPESIKSVDNSCKERLIEAYVSNFGEPDYDDEDTLNKSFESIGKLKTIITGKDTVHVFGDQTHGDNFIQLIIDLIESGCFTRDELNILRSSYFFTESNIVNDLETYGFDKTKLFAVDNILKMNDDLSIHNRMERLNYSWTGYVVSKYQDHANPISKFFIALGRSHIYGHKKSDTDIIVPSFPFVLSPILRCKTYVMYTPRAKKYTDMDVVEDSRYMTKLINFPIIIFNVERFKNL